MRHASKQVSEKLRALRVLQGRRVNLHLEDGSVIVNVRLSGIHSDERGSLLRYETPFGEAEIKLEDFSWAELLNLVLVPTS